MKILVTGGSGFLGSEIIKRLITRGDEVVVLARNEGKLVELKEKFPKVQIVVGDVSDPFAVDKAMRGVDGCIHAAAMKHIGLAEENARECIGTNVLGTFNILESSAKYNLDFVLGISTDKAASRKGVYGSTKFLMERLFSDYQKGNVFTKYRIVRYGNVIYSTGSVLCKWKEKIPRGEMITITNPDATRFFWTVEQAVDLIFECLEKATDATPYVTPMKAMRMGDLMSAMLKKYSYDKIGVNVIGLQPGENMHEIIIEGGLDSSQVEKFTQEEIMKMI